MELILKTVYKDGLIVKTRITLVGSKVVYAHFDNEKQISTMFLYPKLNIKLNDYILSFNRIQINDPKIFKRGYITLQLTTKRRYNLTTQFSKLQLT